MTTSHASESASSSSEVLTVLVDSHRSFLRFLEARLGDRDVAEDLLQAAFVRAGERAHQLRDGESAVAWFYRMLRNAVTDHFRAKGRGDRKLDAMARELADASTAPPDVHAAVCGCVAELLDTLEPDYARALRRVDLDGVAVKDFAAEAAITANNAGVRLFRARKALRRQLARCCGTCADHGCVDCTCRH